MNRGVLLAAMLLLFVPVSAQADDFCMDCVSRWVEKGDGTWKTEATCCMADSRGDCWDGDWMVNPNVGFGCKVSEPDQETGGTSCISTNEDQGCTGGGGGGTGGGGKNAGTECMYDANGWCDASCSSCTWT